MSDHVLGDKIGGSQYNQSGSHNSFTVTHGAPLTSADVDAAITELRTFIAQLTKDGAVTPDGSVADPAAVVTAVETQPTRLRSLTTALARGAKDAILSTLQTGVATLIVALVGKG